MPISQPGWVPPGQVADEARYRYDFKTGWVPPGKASSRTRSQVVMPPGYDPREDKGFEVVVSPPGQRAPEGISYTPTTDEVHGLGESPPIQRTNYTIVPAGSPKGEVPPGTPTAFPMPQPPPGQPPGLPPTPGGSQPLPPGLGAGGPLGRTPPPTPPLNLGAGPSSPTPAGPGGPPMGGPPLPPGMGTPPPGMGAGPPVGGGQDSGGVYNTGGLARSLIMALIPQTVVGAGQDVGVGAAGLPVGSPAYVGGISQNDLPLSQGEAAAACGPAAALFATRMGRQPTREEAADLRQKATAAGWTPGGGMTTGPSGFVRLANSLGVQVETGPADPARIRADATAGLPVVISTGQGRTPGHYWQISDYDAASGKYVMGDAVGARAPGSLMSLTDIQNHPGYGGPTTAIYVAGSSRQIDREPSARAGGASGGTYRAMSAQDQGQGDGPRLGPNGVENAPNAPLQGVSREQFAANAMIHANAASQIIKDNYGVEIPPEVLAGYAAHETGYGTSNLARNYGNFMSIYAPNPWTGASRSFTGDTPVRTVQAGTYNNPTESFVHFGQQIANNSRYRPALEAYQRDHNPQTLLQGMNRAGWAEDQNWWRGVLNSANTVKGIAERAGVTAGQAVQGAAQAAMNIPANVLENVRGLGNIIAGLGSTPAYAAEESGGATGPASGEQGYIIPPDQVPPTSQWSPTARDQISRRAQATVASLPEASLEEAMDMESRRYFTDQLLGPRAPASQAAPRATIGGAQGRATAADSPTPKLEELNPDERARVQAQLAHWEGIGLPANPDAVIRAERGLPQLGQGRPGDLETVPIGNMTVVTGVFDQEGKVQRGPPDYTHWIISEAKRLQGLDIHSPIQIHSGGFTFVQPQGRPESNEWIVSTKDGGFGRVNFETGETQVLQQGTPEQQVEIRNNPSGTGTQVWIKDNQGNATLASNNIDAFAEQLKRYEPHVSTANGVTTVTMIDRATNQATVSRDRDPLGQLPHVSGSGTRQAVTSFQQNAEGTGYDTSTQFRSAPFDLRDVVGSRFTNANGSFVMMPTRNADGTPGPLSAVLLPGTRGVPHFDPTSRAIYDTTGGVPTQIGEMPATRQWFQVRDPFGGIGMMDRATGDFVPVRQAAPKIVKVGRRYIMLTPPELTPMKGVGNRVDDLGQLPWQVRNLTPRAMAIYQDLLSGGSGQVPTDVPPGGTAPTQPPDEAGPPQAAVPTQPGGFTYPPLPMEQMGGPGADTEDSYGTDAEGGAGQYGVQAPSQSQFGLPDTMRLPEPRYYNASPDIEDTGDTGTVGYDEADTGDGAIGYDDEGSYGDEEDMMNRRRRVGAGQSEGYENDPDFLAAMEAIRAGSRGGQYNGGPQMQDPYARAGAKGFGATSLGDEAPPSKGFSHIKGDDGRIYSFNEDTGDLAQVAPGSGLQEREFGLKERQLDQSDRQSAEANAIAREKIGIEREQNQIAADPRKFRLQPHMIDLGRGGMAVYDPETGMVQQVTPREPGDVRAVGRDIYVPAGQTVTTRYGLPGERGYETPTQISGGPYNGWVPTRNTPGLPFGATGGPAGGYQGGGGSPGNGGYSGGVSPGGGSFGRSGMGASGGMGGGPGYGTMGSPGGGGSYGGGGAYGGGPVGIPPQMSPYQGPAQGWSGPQPPPPPGWMDWSDQVQGQPYDPSMGDMGAVEQQGRPIGWQGSWPQGLGQLW